MDPARGLIGVTAVLLAAIFCLAAEPAGAQEKGPLRTVLKVDLSRYMGRWYEIARIPNRFQRRCARDTTATYVLRSDGNVDVINRCVEADGNEVVARGLAKVTDRQTRAQLKVSFVRLLGVRLFWGKYWVIGLDARYRWALVGEPGRKYGWILAREPHLSPEQLAQIHDLLRAGGYDPDRFVTTIHSAGKHGDQP